MCFIIIVLFSIKCYAKNLGSYSFTKSEVIRGCSSRFLVVPSAGSFTDNHFQVGSFVKHLLWHQHSLPPPFLDPPPPIMPMSYPSVPINTEFFSNVSPSLFSIWKLHTPICKWGEGQTMELSHCSTFAVFVTSSLTTNCRDLLGEITFSFNWLKKIDSIEMFVPFWFFKDKVISGFSVYILRNILVIRVFIKTIIDLTNVFK